jgi:hypothetical protein
MQFNFKGTVLRHFKSHFWSGLFGLARRRIFVFIFSVRLYIYIYSVLSYSHLMLLLGVPLRAPCYTGVYTAKKMFEINVGKAGGQFTETPTLVRIMINKSLH